MAIVIYKLSERVPVKIGPVTFLLAPLSTENQGKLLAYTSRDGGEEKVNGLSFARDAIKFCVKGVEGIENSDGSSYELEFDDNGDLTNECVSEIFQVDGVDKLTKVAIRMGLRFADPGVEGVEIDFKNVRSIKKK